MKTNNRYFLLQLKRSLRYFWTMFISTTLLVLSLALLASVMLEKEALSEKKIKTQVGLVGDTSNTYLEFGLFALQHIDSSRFTVDIIEMTEEEAVERMENGTLNAYIIIPEEFAEKLEMGINTPITYVTCNGAMGLTSFLMMEIAEEISNLVTDVENMVFAVQNYGIRHRIREAYQDETVESIFFQVVSSLIDRTELFEIDVTGISNGVTLVEYYLCALTVVLVLFLGIAFCHIFVKKDMTMSKILVSRGCTPARQIVGEYVTYLLLIVTSFLFACVYVGGLYSVFQDQLKGMIDLDESKITLFFAGLLPVILLVTAVQFLLFSAVPDVVSSILIQFVFVFGMGYLSGCFYPVSFLPEFVQNLGGVLPVGAAMRYLQKTILGQMAWKELILMIFYFAGAIGVAILLRKRRTENEE